MYSLDHINRIQADVDILNKYAIRVGQDIAELRKEKIPDDDASVDIYEHTSVDIRWTVSHRYGYDSEIISYPILYLTLEKSQYLEAERIILEQKEEVKKLKELAEKEIKDKNKEENDRKVYEKLKERYEKTTSNQLGISRD